ncbi:MAG TPA: ABC transporter permease [Spirochaetales bacterium]|jgi:NitT/TauT family transport system permease protein/sulfonate transport system permease protein|nr:ABC transporter permease [Spirochaetales bacterium]
MIVNKRVQSSAAAAVSIFMFLLIWHLATRFSELGNILPSPIEVLTAFFVGFVVPVGTHTMFVHIVWSLSRVIPFYILGSAVGIVLGITMGWYPKAEAVFRPIFEIIRPIPPLAWIPISIVWFGIGEGSKWFLIFLAAFITVTMNVYTGAKVVDPVIVRCARMLGANERQIFTTIVLPSSVPFIFAGLQVGLSSSWATVVAAEMIRSSEGVGWIIISSLDVNDTVQTLIGIVGIGTVGYVLAIIIRGIESKLCKWNKRGI